MTLDTIGALTTPTGITHPRARVRVAGWVAEARNPHTGRLLWRGELTAITQHGDEWRLDTPAGTALVGPEAAPTPCGCH